MATAVGWVLEPVTGIPGALPQQVCLDKLGVYSNYSKPCSGPKYQEKLAQLLNNTEHFLMAAFFFLELKQEE